MLKNHVEDVVVWLLPKVLEEYDDICTCEKCKDDIKAIALNKLKPHYVVTKEGESYAKINDMSLQFKTDVMQALMEAANIVKENPKHSK
ncbi:MAG: competence protein ComFB [Firmicutes bacterium]|nr:competence protein ComFB [Bacillota bacterium]